jgi:hypothetical protein
MSSQSLSAFFDEFIPYVMGEHTLAALENRLGPSRSGSLRMEVYAGVVLKNLRIALEAMYPSVKRAAEAVRRGLWDELVAAFLTAHPPRHADPNRCGEALASFLSERREAVGGLPPFLEELADYEHARFRVHTAREPGPERTIVVRRYAHDVPAYATVGAEEATRRIPAATPITVVIYRSTKTLKTGVLAPSKAQLCAIAKLQGELDDDLWSRSGLSDGDLARAMGELRDLGVLEEETRR